MRRQRSECGTTKGPNFAFVAQRTSGETGGGGHTEIFTLYENPGEFEGVLANWGGRSRTGLGGFATAASSASNLGASFLPIILRGTLAMWGIVSPAAPTPSMGSSPLERASLRIDGPESSIASRLRGFQRDSEPYVPGVAFLPPCAEPRLPYYFRRTLRGDPGDRRGRPPNPQNLAQATAGSPAVMILRR